MAPLHIQVLTHKEAIASFIKVENRIHTFLIPTGGVFFSRGQDAKTAVIEAHTDPLSKPHGEVHSKRM
tara:strand:- start:3405 stop:3608 length:204 start_codon:yes stop_codon:yes gene_type:complete